MSQILGNPNPEDVLLFADAANEGDAEAQFRLARCYFWGVGVEKKVDRAIALWKSAVAKDHVEAMVSLGMSYLNDVCGIEMREEGMSLLNTAIKRGSLRAKYFLAHRLVTKGSRREIETGLAQMLEVAEKDVPEASLYIADCFFRGIAVKKDLDRAIPWIIKAANLGEKHAQAYLGEMYLHGYQVDKNVALARQYLEKASSQGHARASFRLGQLCLYGDLIPQDRERGISLLRESAGQNYGLAHYELGRWFRSGHAVRHDAKEACRHFSMAHDLGIKGARIQIYLCYLNSAWRYYYYPAIILITVAFNLILRDVFPDADRFIILNSVLLAYFIPHFAEYLSVLRAYELRIQFGIIEIWASMVGFIPSIYLLGQSFQELILLDSWTFGSFLSRSWLASSMVLAQTMGFVWGSAKSSLKPSKENRQMRRSLEILKGQLIAAAFVIMFAWVTRKIK